MRTIVDEDGYPIEWKNRLAPFEAIIDEAFQKVIALVSADPDQASLRDALLQATKTNVSWAMYDGAVMALLCVLPAYEEMPPG